jgi:hypothetical protein
MELVLCFIPLIVIFIAVPNTFKFECDYPIQLIVSATISV